MGKAAKKTPGESTNELQGCSPSTIDEKRSKQKGKNGEKFNPPKKELPGKENSQKGAKKNKRTPEGKKEKALSQSESLIPNKGPIFWSHKI